MYPENNDFIFEKDHAYPSTYYVRLRNRPESYIGKIVKGALKKGRWSAKGINTQGSEYGIWFGHFIHRFDAAWSLWQAARIKKQIK